MNNISLSHGLHASDKLWKYVHGFLFLKFGVSGDIFRQISTITVFEENVEISLCLFDIDEVDDGVIFAVIKEVDFSLKYFNFII